MDLIELIAIIVKSVLKAIILYIVGCLAFIKIAEWFMNF